jgi:hypothetical protein
MTSCGNSGIFRPIRFMPGVLIIEAEKGTLGGVAGDTNYLPRRGKHASFPPVCSIDAVF